MNASQSGGLGSRKQEKCFALVPCAVCAAAREAPSLVYPLKERDMKLKRLAVRSSGVVRAESSSVGFVATLLAACLMGVSSAANATTTVVNYGADGPSAMAYSGVDSQTYWDFGGSLDSSAKFVDLGNSGFSSATGGVPSPADYNINNEKLWIYVLNQGGDGHASTSQVPIGSLTQVDSDQQYLAGLISIGVSTPSPLPGTPYPPAPVLNVRSYGRSLTPLQGYSYNSPAVHTGTVTTTIPVTPTPEPAALALLGMGALGLLLTRKRKTGVK
jgi:hypothetical protein